MTSVKLPEIVVVGAANADLVSYAKSFPVPGETLVGHTFETTYGGKAANPAVQIGLLLSPEERSKVALVAALGQDAMIENAKIVYCQNETSTETTLETFRIAKESPNKPVTVFAPAPAGEIHPAIYGLCDYILMNTIEAEILCGTPRPEESQNAEMEKWIRNLRKSLVQLGQKSEIQGDAPLNTIVTGGSRKCLYLKAASAMDESSKFGAMDVMAVPPNKTVNTVGAGDSFSGSFIFFLLNGCSMEIALQRASVVAGHSIQRKGASASFFDRSELPQKIFDTAVSEEIEYASL
ncbi:kinase, pfkB family protein [Cardiosporidium cionae]|uniref:Kinase, pfkB family protein n=1 Tax=Cardiosporidium cionae TaxID=476202 RepID=A0ABQ7J7B9_9APIC|nr:kinase, pfkB family protein [Cardiosporidium cionae]|eukprot:KAF8819858.1 kinase, pfkB family protein [Cardiosporidium cionae]